jgi:hypothetical protein
VKLAAVRDAPDRARLKPPAQVEFAARPLAPYEELLVARISYAQTRR